ncbi:MAG: Hsp70 family protein [Nitrospirae bacterium]|nr:Hsp70 family protein [Nitrospirota bacterium]
MEAIITVPAYFTDIQRKMTKLAGYAAGLDVKAIINEPTAAALSYPFPVGGGRKTIMVFDLGGGTFDVTILEFNGKEYNVITSDGAHQLGGKDWDDLIIEHLHYVYEYSTGSDLPEDMVFEIQKKSIEAKLSLSKQQEVTVSVCAGNNFVTTKLERTEPLENGFIMDCGDMIPPFYFETRASNLLAACRSLCLQALHKARHEWFQIDEIVLAGGSCRMPMIPRMLKEISGKDVPTVIPGFDYDTAIAIGAAKYGKIKGNQIVNDVVSHSIGVRCLENNSYRIDHLIRKDTKLPAKGESTYNTASGQGSLVEVYEGESDLPDECIKRGTLRLPQVNGTVDVTMNLDEDNILTIIADCPPRPREIVFDSDYKDPKRDIELKEKVHTIDIKP